MTARALPEWIGKTPEAAIPPRVKLRIIDRQGGRCGACVRKLGMSGEAIEFDHVLALVLGGAHREANLQALCMFCHREKTTQDVAQKAKNTSVRAKHLGVRETKQPLPGGRRTPWKRKINGAVVRRDEE